MTTVLDSAAERQTGSGAVPPVSADASHATDVAVLTEASVIPTRSRRTVALLAMLRRPGVIVALVFVAFVLLTAIFPSMFSTHDPTAASPAERLQPPSWAHWFGTDELGRDLWSRMMHGGTLSVSAALIAVSIALVGGIWFGVVSGFIGGWVDAVIMRLVDVFLAIPGLLLTLTIVTAIGFGTIPVAIAVGIGIIPGFTRLTRAEVLRVKTLPYIEAARSGGAGWGRILITHVVPNSWGPVAVLAVLDFGGAILAVAALSFLGFGAAPPAAEWGTLISQGRAFLATAPYVALIPGVFVGLIVFALNHLSKTLEELDR